MLSDVSWRSLSFLSGVVEAPARLFVRSLVAKQEPAFLIPTVDLCFHPFFSPYIAALIILNICRPGVFYTGGMCTNQDRGWTEC